MPTGWVITADILVLAGYVLCLRVFRENSYASRIVEFKKDQVVITTGPYAVVRHSMYLAVSIMYSMSPLALGSVWALISVPFLVALLVARIRFARAFVCPVGCQMTHSREEMPSVWSINSGRNPAEPVISLASRQPFSRSLLMYI